MPDPSFERPLTPPPAETETEHQRGFSDIVFTPRQVGKRGRKKSFVSSDPSRKIIELHGSSIVKPQDGVSYEVVVVEDTKPDDPMSGKYVVKIVPKLDDMQKVWQDAEIASNLAEPLERQRRRAASVLYAETGIEASKRRTRERSQVLSQSRRQRVARRALENEELYSEEAGQLIGEGKDAEQAFVQFQRRNLIAALRAWDQLEFGRYAVETQPENGEPRTGESQTSTRTQKRRRKKIEPGRQDLLLEEVELLKSMGEPPNGEELGALEDVRSELRQIEEEQQALLNSNPEAYYGLRLRSLLDAQAQGREHRIVETSYVRGKIEDILTHYRAGKPVLLYGHLGSGKTELAMHIAREYLGKEALVISGSKHTSLGEIYGHQVLTIDQALQEQLREGMASVEREWKQWKDANPAATSDEQKLAHDRILQFTLSQFQGGTISKFLFGPIFRAMEEGRPVIIDEVNAIPHEVLISLNFFLTRKAGETIPVQQEGGRELKIREGFGVIMTGNLNQGQQIYVDRNDLDPAFLSRLHKTEYDYLPNATEGDLESEAGSGNELFHLILSKVVDRNGNLHVPAGSLDKLWALSKAARLTQDVFSGKHIGTFLQPGSRDTKYLLKESVLSNRALDAILTQWQREGYRYELDYYVWKEFIEQSTSASDRAYLYQVFHDKYGFFSGQGWPDEPNYGSGGQVAAFQVRAPANAAPSLEFFGPRQVVDAAFGKGPERKEWPGGLQRQPVESPPPPPDPGKKGEVEKTEQQRRLDQLKAETIESIDIARKDNKVSEAEALIGLAGIDTPETLALRREWITRSSRLAREVGFDQIAQSLVGCDSDEAWKLRDELFGDLNTAHSSTGFAGLLQSLRGCASERAWEVRRVVLADFADDTKSVPPQEVWQALLGSLAGDDSPLAWQARELLADRVLPDYMLHELVSLTGIDSPRAWEVRRNTKKLCEDGIPSVAHDGHLALLESIAGIDTKEAWDLRNAEWAIDFSDEEMNLALSKSVAGIDDENTRIWKENVIAAKHMRASLAGLVSDESKALRGVLWDQDELKSSMVESWYSNEVLEAVKLFRRQQEAKEGARLPGQELFKDQADLERRFANALCANGFVDVSTFNIDDWLDQSGGQRSIDWLKVRQKFASAREIDLRIFLEFFLNGFPNATKFIEHLIEIRRIELEKPATSPMDWTRKSKKIEEIMKTVLDTMENNFGVKPPSGTTTEIQVVSNEDYKGWNPLPGKEMTTIYTKIVPFIMERIGARTTVEVNHMIRDLLCEPHNGEGRRSMARDTLVYEALWVLAKEKIASEGYPNLLVNLKVVLKLGGGYEGFWGEPKSSAGSTRTWVVYLKKS